MATANKNIISVFLQAAAANPEGIALLQNGQSVCFRELRDEVISTAAFYESRGISKGDMVLVFVPMSLPLYRIVLALFYLGACPVFLDEWVSLARLKECLKVVPCKAFIAGPSFLFLSFFIAPLRRIPVRISAAKAPALQGARPPAAVDDNDTALVTFTTGSTGTPKAANRTHAYLFAQLAALNPLLDKASSPCMTLLPIVVLLHLASGKTAALPPRGFKPKKPATVVHLAHAIDNCKAAALIASPAIVSLLIGDRAIISGATFGAAFRRMGSVITGGGPVYPDLAKQMLDAFPAAIITAVYGSTEAEPIAHISADELSQATLDDLLTKGLPVGRPDAAAEVAILGLGAGPGEILENSAFAQNPELKSRPGEVIVAGAHVLQHYINNPLAEAQTKLHIDGKVWHRTGDCGVLDGAGNLYLLGRCQEMFVWNGRQYYPAIISYYLQIKAGVGASAIMMRAGMPMLILERADAKLLPEVKESLAAMELSKAAIHFIRKIPRDARHQTKVDYAKLAEVIAGG